MHYKKVLLTLDMVNGMTVTRLVTSEVKMSDISCMWYDDNTGFDYDKERERAFLLPQWGIYVCAYSRHRILTAIHSIGRDAVYSDTDSLKFIGDHSDYFEAINKQTEKIMIDVCKRYNLPIDLFNDLGSFENEYGDTGVTAKFLGAKRYITLEDDGYHTTIAGLPKKALSNYLDKLKIQYEIYGGKYPDMFEIFTDKMLLNSDVSLKNAHTYNDDYHSNIIDGVKCEELSSVGIYPIDFTMKLSQFYLALIQAESEEQKNYESRIY